LPGIDLCRRTDGIWHSVDGVSRNGKIEESHYGDQVWDSVSTGIEVRWPGYMVECFFQVDKELLAILSNGELGATQLFTGLFSLCSQPSPPALPVRIPNQICPYVRPQIDSAMAWDHGHL